MIDNLEYLGGIEEKGKKEKGGPLLKLRFIIVISVLGISALVILINYAIIMLGPVPTVSANTRITADRGHILDRNGRILAIQTRLGNISVWRPGINDIDSEAAILSPLLAMSETEIKEKIELSGSDFIYLKKQVDQAMVREIKNKIDDGLLVGINIEPVMGRIYPEQELAAQIIGFAGDDNSGLAGIEYAFDEELRAKPGDKQGGIQGNNVVLTIDNNIQYILEEIAEKVLKENEAESVMLMAMAPRTGDILGQAVKPGFDPNLFKESGENLRMNRPAIWAYEPGSVFKVFSIASILDSIAIRPDTFFLCNGRYERTTNLGERTVINCLGTHGRVNARSIIILSCNAVSGLNTLRGSGCFSSSFDFPSLSVMRKTIRGVTITPSFAIALAACIICNAETAIS
ncbi:hypothetical protein AGMMS50212_16040 [Spirochaetia bacterium]|nr:hypothetical protein AGMMS50212_16040 [Spirochaetia bacterium]